MEVMEPALLTLLDEGRAAGIRVELEGPDEAVVLRGPRTAEPIAKALLEHKPALRTLLSPCYSAPWPEVLPTLARRTVDFITWCKDCNQRATWVRYADRPTCLLCALKAVKAVRVPRPKDIA